MIRVVSATGSTNADLAARMRDGEAMPEGAWLVTDRQTAGRGRSGRGWSDAAGNFMGSTVVHLRGSDPAPPTLALVAGLALHGVVDRWLTAGRAPDASDARTTRGALMLKWPNDLLFGGAKLAGILLEREGDSVIVGIGVNLVVAPRLADRPTVALAELGEPPSRDDFAERLAGSFATELGRWRDFGLAPIVRRWCAAGYPDGTALAVDGPGAPQGRFAGLDDAGALRLRMPDGTVRTVHAGEVRLTTMAGE